MERDRAEDFEGARKIEQRHALEGDEDDADGLMRGHGRLGRKVGELSKAMLTNEQMLCEVTFCGGTAPYVPTVRETSQYE